MLTRYSRIGGIDFSGRAHAGKAIWIAEGTPLADRLCIDFLSPLYRLPGSARNREPALAFLRERLSSRPDVMTGLDFPFSLPAMLLDGRSWQGWLTGTMARFSCADSFRADCLEKTGHKQIRRATELEAKTPFCPYFQWIYPQSYWGMAHVLAPLVSGSAALVAPFMDLRAGVPALIEICPASTLKSWWGSKGANGYKRSSKRKSAKARAGEQRRRADIAEALADRGVVMSNVLKNMAIEDRGGDAIDALLAAYATWQTWLHPERLLPRAGSTDIQEGRVYH